MYFRHFIPDFLPGICYLCHEKSRDTSLLCNACRQDILGDLRLCFLCARPLYHSMPVCSQCSKSPPLVDRVITAFSYNFPVNNLVKKLKYSQKIIIAQLLAEQLSGRILKASTNLPGCIIPVPLHPCRYITRGFNQALEIANILGKRLSIPVDSHLLARSRNTRAQFDLKPFQRKQNIKNAFRLVRKPEIESVAIVDDVMTTGATINEITRILKKSGIKRVEAWVCATTDPAASS